MKKNSTFYDLVCKKYGDVFLGLDHDVSTDFDLFVTWARSHPMARSLLIGKNMPRSMQKRALELFFKSHTVHMRSVAALYTLAEHHRLPYLTSVLSYIKWKKENMVHVFVQSAQKISEKAVQEITRSIASRTHKKPHIHLDVNPDLLMGITAVWNCCMVDASLKKLVQSMESEDQKT